MEETGFEYVCRIGETRAACILQGINKSADPLALERFRGQNRWLPSNQPASVYGLIFWQAATSGHRWPGNFPLSDLEVEEPVTEFRHH